MPFAPFTYVHDRFNEAVSQTLLNATTNAIALISPVMAVCFSIYVLLILVDYWRGVESAPILDFLMKIAGWATIITFGLNIDMYRQYVAPFILGLGEDLTGLVGSNHDSAAALDQMASALLDTFLNMYEKAEGIKLTIFAALTILILSIPTSAFMVIAIGYVMLAEFAQSVLASVGPLFIGAMLFPPTRDLFKNWTGQVLNYAFLIMLFSFTAQIQIALMQDLVPRDFALADIFTCILASGLMVFVSLNLPSLAAALAGGIGISTMARKLPKLPGRNRDPKVEPGGGGGDIKPTSEPDGGAMKPEQK